MFSGQPPLKLIGALVVVIAIGVLLVVVASGGGSGGADAGVTIREVTNLAGLADEPLPTPEATIDVNRPTAIAQAHLGSVAAGDRLVISRFGVDAPLSYKKVGLDGQMPDPDTADEVAYYDFSAWAGLGGAPGKGGNAVFSGHVDSGRRACKNGTVPPPCQAVLWDLRNIRSGDEIQVRLDGQVFRYRVVTSEHLSAANTDWSKIVSSTAQETLTVITCGGEFDRRTGEYNIRTVVTAVRI